MDTKMIERFWEKVDVPPSDDVCWNWLAGKNKQGYGEFTSSLRNGKHTRAHQVSWIIHFGDIPEGMHVLHTCDNPSCVNPKHLFLGSHTDNMRDMIKKGRANRRFLYGEEHPQHGTNSKFHKLTEDDVRKIRELKKSGKYKLREIAEMFGVSHGVINNICQGRKWAWLK